MKFLILIILISNMIACGLNDLPSNPGGYSIIEEGNSSNNDTDKLLENDTDLDSDIYENTDEDLVQMWSCIICEAITE